MNQKTSLRGTMLVEVLMASLLALIIGAALLAFVRVTYNSGSVIAGQGNAEAQARRCLDILANNLINAQMVKPPTIATASAFSETTSSAITLYTSTTATTTARYWLDTSTVPGRLTQTVGGVNKVLLPNVQSLQFTYYVNNSSNFTGTDAQWVPTADPSSPTATERSNIGTIGITATINANGYVRAFSTTVRLRNSPYKPNN